MHESPDPILKLALSRFLREQNEAGLSYRRMAVRAVDPVTKRKLGFQWISKLAAGQIPRSPELWQLRALAAALDVSENAVKELAARQWLEYEVGEVSTDSHEWILFRLARDLPEEDKRILRRMAEEFVQRQQQMTEPPDVLPGPA